MGFLHEILKRLSSVGIGSRILHFLELFFASVLKEPDFVKCKVDPEISEAEEARMRQLKGSQILADDDTFSLSLQAPVCKLAVDELVRGHDWLEILLPIGSEGPTTSFL